MFLGNRHSALVLIVGLCAMGCARSALTDATARERLAAMPDLPLPSGDLKILGIADGDAERIVKEDFGGTVANVKFRRFDKGWSPEQYETVDGRWVDLRVGLAAHSEIEARAAQSALEGLVSGQAAYAASCGGGFYASSLAVLTTVPPGGSVGFIIDDLRPASGQTFAEKWHYRFEVRSPPSDRSPVGCQGVPAGTSGETWAATATRLKGYAGNSYRIDADGRLSAFDGAANERQQSSPSSAAAAGGVS